MGKKHDAYEKAAQAETAVRARYQADPSEQNLTEAKQAELNSNDTWKTFINDPEG